VNYCIEQVRAALKKELPGRAAQEKMIGRVISMPVKIPDDARQSAVLCLLYPVEGSLNVLLMKRMEDRTAHSGQVSFPGGRYEQTDKDLMHTALREAHEEVGIDAASIEVLGALTSLYIPVSNFNVSPYIGYAHERPVYDLSHAEVSYTIELPLEELFSDERKTVAEVVSPAAPVIKRKVNAYQLQDGTIIWGATAMILSELETMLKQ
jgi:8-oxo-dGTP pyrophosphatase MutT (NUDIX family)